MTLNPENGFLVPPKGACEDTLISLLVALLQKTPVSGWNWSLQTVQEGQEAESGAEFAFLRVRCTTAEAPCHIMAVEDWGPLCSYLQPARG